MITMTATIELGQNANGTIDTATISEGGNNVSSLITSVLDRKVAGSSIFLLGSSKLGSGAVFTDGVDYYVGNLVSDNDGYFNPPYVLTVSGSDIMGISIVFDDYNIEYATELYVDGVLHYNNSITFATELEEKDTHTIIINRWSKPNTPLRIQGIFVSLNIDLSILEMISINFKRMTSGDYTMPSWGIISNSGSIEFNDLNQRIQEYIKKEMIKQNLKCTINLNNTLTMTTKRIATMYTDKWEYDNDSRIVNVSIKDDLEEWQDILVNEISYDPDDTKEHTFAELYNKLKQLTPSKFNMLNLDDLDLETQSILATTYCRYPLLKSGNLWSSWDKLCVACQLYIYKNSRNETVCSYRLGA